MEEITENIELNESWQAKKNPFLLLVFETFLPFLLMPIAVFTTAVSISIIFKGMDIPVLNFLGFPVGFLMILALWIFSMLTIAIFLGKFHFANSIFSLLGLKEFRTSQMLLLIAVFASKMIYSAITYGNPSFTMRLAMLIVSCVAVLVNTIIISLYAVKSGLPEQFYYVYAVEFILFSAMTILEFSAIKKSKDKPKNREAQDV